MPDASWVLPQQGVYLTEADFFANSGGILKASPHYEEMFASTNK